MTKILNLDDLETQIEKSIVLKGVSYRMQPFSVEQFINQMKELDAMASSEMTGLEMYEASLQMIARAFPTLPEASLREMTTFQVDAIFQFLKAKTEEEAERGASEGNAEGEAST